MTTPRPARSWPIRGRVDRRRAAAVLVLLVALGLVLRACRDRSRTTSSVPTTVRQSTLPPTTPGSSATTTAPAAVTASAPTLAPTTTAPTTTATAAGVSTTSAAATALPSSPSTSATAPATTPVPTTGPVPPCTPATLTTALQAGGVDTTAIELADPRCTADFASVIVRQADRQDRFAVFELREPVWMLVNIGTSFVCQRLEIPNPDYTDIGCLAWDR